MIYLTGATNDEDEPALIAAGLGLMVQPGNSYHLRIDRFPWWAADNGCFADRWVEAEHLAWLDRLPSDRCLFAVAPDVYPDAVATLERAAGYFELIRAMGFPVALVAQDGAERLALPWDDFDVLFVGGARQTPAALEWKVSDAAAGLVARARAAGKWVHMGRVNSLRRLERARLMGCNSADGTHLKYERRTRKVARAGARGSVELAGWHEWLDRHPVLFRHEAPALPVHRAAAGERSPRRV